MQENDDLMNGVRKGCKIQFPVDDAFDDELAAHKYSTKDKNQMVSWLFEMNLTEQNSNYSCFFHCLSCKIHCSAMWIVFWKQFVSLEKGNSI